jgi:hypothetical protein
MVDAARNASAHKESLKNEPKNGRTLFPFFLVKTFASFPALTLPQSERRKLDEILILSLYVLCFFRGRSETHKGDF